jgi:Uma2 family endonuclease
MPTSQRAALEDLYRVDGKAELVHGQIVREAPTGDGPGTAAGAIYASLRAYARQTGHGRAYPDNVGFHVHLPHRESFSPDAAYYTGPRTGMRFLEGAPDFAVEVRSESDYGPQAEHQIAQKRADYFAAGTLVVWDVDLLSENVIRVYRQDTPTSPTLYQRDEIAEAEPAVPGWTFPTEELFE